MLSVFPVILGILHKRQYDRIFYLFYCLGLAVRCRHRELVSKMSPMSSANCWTITTSVCAQTLEVSKNYAAVEDDVTAE
jgi:hypothetical protein